jgi:transposase
MKKRPLTNQQKMQLVLEGMRGKTSIAALCNTYEIVQSQYYKWRDLLLSGPDICAGSRQRKGPSET